MPISSFLSSTILSSTKSKAIAAAATAAAISAAVIGSAAVTEGAGMVFAATPNVPRAVFNLFKAHSKDENVRTAAQHWNQVVHGSLAPVVEQKFVFGQDGKIVKEANVTFEKKESRILRLHSTKKGGNGRWANRIITEQWFAYQVMKSDEEASKKLDRDYCEKHFPALCGSVVQNEEVKEDEQSNQEIIIEEIKDQNNENEIVNKE